MALRTAKAPSHISCKTMHAICVFCKYKAYNSLLSLLQKKDVNMANK